MTDYPRTNACNISRHPSRDAQARHPTIMVINTANIMLRIISIVPNISSAPYSGLQLGTNGTNLAVVVDDLLAQLSGGHRRYGNLARFERLLLLFHVDILPKLC